MKIKNPARHYPAYRARLCLQNGKRLNMSGTASPEIDLRVDEKDVKAVVLECLDSGRAVQATSLLVAGEWLEYTDEALEAVLNPPKPEPKPEPDRGLLAMPKVRKLPKPKSEPATKLNMQVEVSVDKDVDEE